MHLTARNVSHLLFIGLLIVSIRLSLGPVILAGLFSYMILHATHAALTPAIRKLYARWLSVLIFTIIAVLIVWMFVTFIKQTLATLPKIAIAVTPKVVELNQRLRLNLPLDNMNEIRKLALLQVRDNIPAITRTGGLLTKGVFHILVGMFIAVLVFMRGPTEESRPNLYDALRQELNKRLKVFIRSFERVFGAQVIISAINTALTAVFLISMDIPYIAFLVPATFIFGILPIIGNIISNTLIVGTALTISPQHAATALIFLVVIHKVEYFLNSRIVGSSINVPMWLTLLGILVGEMVMGVPGIILAPTLIHYTREELQAVPTGR